MIFGVIRHERMSNYYIGYGCALFGSLFSHAHWRARRFGVLYALCYWRRFLWDLLAHRKTRRLTQAIMQCMFGQYCTYCLFYSPLFDERHPLLPHFSALFLPFSAPLPPFAPTLPPLYPTFSPFPSILLQTFSLTHDSQKSLSSARRFRPPISKFPHFLTSATHFPRIFLHFSSLFLLPCLHSHPLHRHFHPPCIFFAPLHILSAHHERTSALYAKTKTKKVRAAASG